MKRFRVFVLVIALLGAFTLILSGCGGGGGGTSSTQTISISGTVATGKPLAGATVWLKDVNSNIRSVTADADGKFSIDTTNLTPPFYLRTQGYNLYSYTDQKSGTANITPLTTAVVAIANGGNPDIFTSPPAQPLDIVSAKNKLLQEAGVGQVMQKYGVPADADPISTKFDANGTGMDAVLDSIVITVHTDKKNIEIKNPFTNIKIGEITFFTDTDGTPRVRVPDSVDQTEVDNLPQTVTHKKYFASVKDNYGNPEYGPVMVDTVDDGKGNLSVTLTAIEGDSGDPFLIYGNGRKSGNDITFTVHVIMCSNTDPNANSANANAVFTGTIGPDGTITGTFTNTLPAGDTCRENNSNTYSGTFTAYDVTNATPVNMSGTYNAYATPFGGWPEKGPATLTITQNGNSINASLTIPNGPSISGRGTVYGNYVMFAIPVIMCHDTNANAVAENAIFFGKFDSTTNTITGIYGDGIPSGDYCKAIDYDRTGHTTKATGTWRAVKK